MAITVAILNNTVAGQNRVVTATVTLDTSYVSGGYALTPSLFGLYAVPLFVDVEYPNCHWVQSTNKLMVRDANGTEVASGTNVSGIVANVKLTGS